MQYLLTKNPSNLIENNNSSDLDDEMEYKFHKFILRNLNKI